MNIFRTLTAALLATIIIGFVPTASSNAAEAAATLPETVVAKTLVEPPTRLTLVNATADQTESITEAIGMFDDANLILPPLQIEFHETTDGCKGHAGLYRPATAKNNAGVDRIDICNRMKIIALHELAHAWKQHNLTAETRQAFSASWGLDSWNDKGAAHLDRGIERAAHTIAFSLNQGDTEISDSVMRYLCGYELLTGTTLEIHTKIDC